MKYIFLFATCVLFACQKPILGDVNAPGSNNNSANAKVVWTGPVETDGCGWTLQINDTFYHPETLSEDFQQDQLNVIVSYQATKGIFACGIAGNGLPIIQITSIRKE